MTGSVIPFPQQRAVICVRVSPRPADKVKYSPEIQEQQCRDWCDQRGIAVVGVVSDIMVSGGDPNRFAKILKSLTDDRPTHFVVADLSRWTRDEPLRYWAMRALIEDGGAKVYSVNQDYLNDTNLPFQATLTTAHVEMAHQERLTLKRKVAEGVAKARATGKVFGRWPFRWVFNGETRAWVIDAPSIIYLYESVENQVSYHQISQRLNCPPSNIPKYIRAKAQRQVVGDDLWERANDRLSRRFRSPRRGTARSSIYRGLLICPCGYRMHQDAHWGNYRCLRPQRMHEWAGVSASRHVTPAVRELLSQMRVPHTEAELLQIASTEPPAPPRRDPADIQSEIDRLGLLFASNRLSQSVYEQRVSVLEQEMEEPVLIPPRPPEAQVQIIRTLRVVDLMDQRPETGDAANRILKEVLYPIRIGANRQPIIRVREEYQHWFVVA